MEGIGNQGERMHRVPYRPIRQSLPGHARAFSCLPTTSSSKKNAESIASRIKILLDLERPMAAVIGMRTRYLGWTLRQALER